MPVILFIEEGAWRGINNNGVCFTFSMDATKGSCGVAVLVDKLIQTLKFKVHFKGMKNYSEYCFIMTFFFLSLDKLLESTLSKYVWYTNIFSNIWKSFWRTYIQLNDEIFFCLFLQKALFMPSFNATLMKNCWLMGAVRWDYIIPRSNLKKKL